METGFQSVNVDTNSAYELSFGKMAEGTIYAGGVSEYENKMYDRREDLRKEQNERVQKDIAVRKDRGSVSDIYASGTSYTATSGSLPILIPIYVDADIINLVRKETPLYEMLPKKAVRGKTYDWNQLSTLNTASFLNEGASLPVSDDAYTRVTTPIKLAYATGKVSGFAQAAMTGYIDILRQEVMTHTRALVQLIEQTTLTGDASTTAVEFSGFDKLIATNATDKSSAEFVLDDLRTSIRLCRQGGATIVGGGNPNLIVMNLVDYDKLKGLLQAYLRYPAPTYSIAWGIQTMEFEGLPIIFSKFANITTNSRRIYILDTSVVFYAILQDITYQDLARVDDANKFMLKWYGALIIQAETWCAQIYGIGV